MRTKKNFIILLVVVIALVVAWFAFSQYFVTSQPNPTQGPSITDTPNSTPPGTQIATGTPVQTPEAPLTITQNDTNKTFTVAKGSRIVIKLGDTQQWTLAFNPQGIVNRIKNIMPIRGSQGVFTADSVGTTTLTAEGRPICNPGEMCAQYIINFTATIVVK